MRCGARVLLSVGRQKHFPSVLLQPLGHLSVFRINNLRAVDERLSHTPLPLAHQTAKANRFSDLEPIDDERRRQLCKTSSSPDHLRRFARGGVRQMRHGVASNGRVGASPGTRPGGTGSSDRMEVGCRSAPVGRGLNSHCPTSRELRVGHARTNVGTRHWFASWRFAAGRMDSGVGRHPRSLTVVSASRHRESSEPRHSCALLNTAPSCRVLQVISTALPRHNRWVSRQAPRWPSGRPSR